ncbi:MAG: hypothetical protein JWM97_2925 [Phycisphaerales bacterium]|nr:hypothetical protein [Phycisphaerales bacterium]
MVAGMHGTDLIFLLLSAGIGVYFVHQIVDIIRYRIARRRWPNLSPAECRARLDGGKPGFPVMPPKDPPLD